MTKRPKGKVITTSFDKIDHKTHDTTTDSAHSEMAILCKTARLGIAILFMWWGTWTLADQLVLQFSPYLEVTAVVIGALIYSWENLFACIVRHRDIVTVRLQNTLQRL
jgi:hypothetical protein